MKNGNMPSAPTKGELHREESAVWDYQVGNGNEFQFTGLTKREHFAGLAMQGLLANNSSTISFWAESGRSGDDIVSVAIRYADALLVKLEEDVSLGKGE